jgi:RimJ/RimL family protein N-acetyltransferase
MEVERKLKISARSRCGSGGTLVCEVSIRDVTQSDLDRLTEYYFQFYDEVKVNPNFGLTLFDAKPSLLDEMAWFLDFQKASAEGNSIGLVAVADDGKILGFSEVGRRKPTSSVSHRGSLGISVRKEYRGKGIGTLLLKKMIERCKGKFEILELEVFVGNDVAKHLYERLGFKTYGLRPQAVKRAGKYIDEELMYLKL